MGATYSERTRDRVEEELSYKELDVRRAHGIEVFLQWHKRSNTLRLVLNDEIEGLQYKFPVPNDKGLDALNHPFAWAADQQGHEYMPEIE
jgi:hypothetical protein